jgi:hypothetical protein
MHEVRRAGTSIILQPNLSAVHNTMLPALPPTTNIRSYLLSCCGIHGLIDTVDALQEVLPDVGNNNSRGSDFIQPTYSPQTLCCCTLPCPTSRDPVKRQPHIDLPFYRCLLFCKPAALLCSPLRVAASATISPQTVRLVLPPGGSIDFTITLRIAAVGSIWYTCRLCRPM